MSRIIISSILILISFYSKAQGKKHQVEMINFAFEPEILQISAGDTVEWINKTKAQHTSTSGTNCEKNRIWDSGLLDKGETFTHVFSDTGSFPYYCIPHCLAGMKGEVIVSTNGPQVEKKPTISFFSDTRTINAPSVEVLDQGVLDVRITHRFNNIAGTSGGFHTLYGLDNLRDIRLGVDYGITNNIMIGIGRSKGDQFQSEIQQVREIYDFFFKASLLTMDDRFPLKISFYGNVAATTMPDLNIPDSEANFQRHYERFSYAALLPIAIKPEKNFSIQITPSYIRRNWVVGADEENIFALGGAFRYRPKGRFGYIVEYFHVLSDLRQEMHEQYSDPLAVGVEIYTGGHIFTINLSNSTGIIPNTFIPYTGSSWFDGEFRLGFTISRLFQVKKTNKSN